jgi:mannitol/fructose-specific phosphotransferase system IIA component (Ntr-type)
LRTSATIQADRQAAPLLEAFLRPTLFLPELQSRKKPAVLEELVEALVSAGVARHGEVVLEALRQREALGSTGIGKGVAVPHARSTLIGERAVLMARSSRGVDFDSPDGLPVTLLFLIVAPPMERDPVYLKLLADIVRGVRLAKARRRLLEAADFDSAREVLLHACAE